jgi:hypothetical protein
MNDSQPFLDAVVSICAEIEAWLAGAASSDAALDALLARFAPAFTMTGTDGACLDHAGLRALFARLAGYKPGLEIRLAALRTIAAYPGGAVIGYDEHQRDASGPLRARRSTAVLERDAADGRIRWLHLQETWLDA